MTRLTLPIAAACAVFMAAALPATAQDKGPQVPDTPQSQTHSWRKTPADPLLMLHVRMDNVLEELSTQKPSVLTQGSKVTCYSLRNDQPFRYTQGHVSFSADLFRAVEVPAIAKGDKRVPVTGDAYTTFNNLDQIQDLLTGRLLGCTTNLKELRAVQAEINGDILADLEARINPATKKLDRGPKNIL